MNKRVVETLETIDLDQMDSVSGGCAKCTGAAAAPGGNAKAGGAAHQQRLSNSGAMRR